MNISDEAELLALLRADPAGRAVVCLDDGDGFGGFTVAVCEGKPWGYAKS